LQIGSLERQKRFYGRSEVYQAPNKVAAEDALEILAERWQNKRSNPEGTTGRS
jgi:hypothetical protein